MKMFQLLFCGIALVAFQGCYKKIEKKDIKSLKKEKLNYKEILAQHSEIPDALLGFEVISIKKDITDPQALEVVYKSLPKNKIFNPEEIKKSYVADMEMLGWKIIGEFDSTETIQLIFQKAGSKVLSSVTISPDLLIKVMVYSKK